MVMNGSAITYGLPDNIDKSTGNYIYVSLDVVNENPINIRLTYGPSSGSFDFTIPPGEGTRAFAIRVSSQYNWYGKDNRTISFYAPSASAIHFKKVILLKGD